MNVSGHERIAGLCQWLVFAFFFKGEQFVFSEISEPMIFRIFWSALKETCWFVFCIYSSWNSLRAPLALSSQTIGQQKGYGRCVWNIILSTGNLRKQPGIHVSSPVYPWDPRRRQQIEWQTRPLLGGSAGSPFVHLSVTWPCSSAWNCSSAMVQKSSCPSFYPPALALLPLSLTGCHLTALTSSLCIHFFPSETSSGPCPLASLSGVF